MIPKLDQRTAPQPQCDESLRRLADAIPEVFWVVALDPERVLYVSPSFERMWGFTAEALYREPRLWTEAIHPEDRPRVTERFSRWVAGGDVKLAAVAAHATQFSPWAVEGRRDAARATGALCSAMYAEAYEVLRLRI